MMADELIEADSNPPSLGRFENHYETQEQYRRDAFMKGVFTSRGKTTPLFPIEDQPTIVRQRRPREVYKRSEAEASGTYPLSNKRKREDSYSTSPDLPESPWDDNDAGLIVRDMSSAVKRFKTPHTSGSDYLESMRVRGHINSRKPQGQQSHKFPGVGRTLGGPPPPQRTTILSFGSSLSAEPFRLCVETAMSLHEKGNILGNGMAIKGPEGRFREQQPLRFMQLNGRVTVEENDTRMFVPEVGPLPTELEPDEVSDKEEEFLVPKLEPGLEDEDVLGSLPGLGGLEKESEDGSMIPTVAKRPRGRPRKYPLPVPGEATNSPGKGRSKTGCITCRKRKKKCDEAKPGCKLFLQA